VHLIGSIAELTSEGDDFGNDELGDTAGVGEGGVEDGDTIAGSVIEVDLVGTDTEAADDEQVLGLTEDLLGELRLGTDADDLDFTNLLNELVLGQRGLESLDLVALSSQDLLSSDIDVLEKQDLDILGVERLENLGGAATAGEVGGPARRRRVERSDWGGGKVLVPAVRDFALSSSREAASDILRSRRHDGVWLFCWSRMEGQMAAGWSGDSEDVLSRNTREVKTSRLLLLGNCNQ